MSKDTKKGSPASNAKGTTTSTNKYTKESDYLQDPDFDMYIVKKRNGPVGVLSFKQCSYSLVEHKAVQIVFSRNHGGLHLKGLRELADEVFVELVFLLDGMAEAFSLHWAKPKVISPVQAAELLFAHETIRMVCSKETIAQPASNGVLAHYVSEGDFKGIYREIGRGQLDIWANDLAGTVNANWKKEFIQKIHDIASQDSHRVFETDNPSLIPMKNGIYNYETGELIDFNPDIVLLRVNNIDMPLTKPPVPYHTLPDGTQISPEDLLYSFAPYEGGVDLLIKVIGAVLRHKHNWRVMVTLYNKNGKNGKSTFLDMLKAMVGPSGYMTSNLETLAGGGDTGRFGISNIVGVSLITCEDSDSGSYIRDNSRLKSIISHDTVSVERKGEPLFDYQPNALIVAAANNLSKTKDKGNAWLDRNIFVPFTGTFSGKNDDKKIREQWVVSKEFSAYMAYLALIETDKYYELPEPEEALAKKKEFILDNDPIAEFWDEMSSSFKYYDFIPNVVIWKRYQEWLPENRESTPMPSRKSFTTRFTDIACNDGEWMQPMSGGKGALISCDKWLFSGFSISAQSNVRHTIGLSSRERGLVRTKMWDYCQTNNTTPVDLGADKWHETRKQWGILS